MGFTGKQTPVPLEDLYMGISDEEIASKYLGIAKIPCIINSPLRKDEHPSFRIKMSRNGAVFYKDYRTGETGHIIELLSKMWVISRQQVINKIYYDNASCGITVNRKKASRSNISDTKINVRIREFNNEDLEFWGKYGISKEWLEFGDIYSISHMFFTNNGNTYRFPAEKYAYTYIERKDGCITMKIYQPYSKKYKWINKHDNSVWDLWEKLPETGEHLIITSSRKDALAIWANTGIPSTSLQSENVLPKMEVVNLLKTRFKNIYVLFDNDFDKEENVGSIYGSRMAEEHQIVKMQIPSIYESKDPSDLVKNHGVDVLKKFIENELFNITDSL